MKLFLLSTIALAFPVTLAHARGDSRAFGAKASKTRKSQHGVFDSKSSKSVSQTSATVDGTSPFTDEDSLPIDEGRPPKNSEDGGLVVVDGTEGAGSSEEGDDLLWNDTFDDDYSPSSSEGFDPADAMFEWLTKCAAADLDKDTCLIAKTLDSLVEYSSDDDTTLPSKRFRTLQQEEGCRPELTQQDLRNVMDGARADCTRVSAVYSDEHFKRLFYEFWTVLSSDSCWTELCESPDIFFKLMFDHAVQCANVDFDVDQCITDHIFLMLFTEPAFDDDYEYDYDYYGADDSLHALRLLQEAVNGDMEADCVEVNQSDLAFVASFVLTGARGHCAEKGVSVTWEDISKASADLITLFSSPHCWGDAHACPEDDASDADDDVDVLGPNDDSLDVGNATWLSNSTTTISETTSTRPAGISPANEVLVDALSNDGYPLEADEEFNFIASTVEEEADVNEGVSFNNSTTAESLDDDESTMEDDTFLIISEENDIVADVNQTSIEGSINATSSIVDDDDLSLPTEGDEDEAADEEDVIATSTIDEGDSNTTFAHEDNLSEFTDDDIKSATSLNIDEGDGNATAANEDNLSASTDDDVKSGTSINIGEAEGNTTSANEDTPINIDEAEAEGNGTSAENNTFSTFVPFENETAPILNSSTSENTTIPSSSDNSTAVTFNPEMTDGSCDVGPRSGVSERSIEVPYFYIVETIVFEGVADEIEGMLHLMMCINGVDRRLSVESAETSLVALESSPEDIVSTEYVCVAQNKEAQSCNVIEGMSTLIVDGPDDPEQEEELMTNFYLQLEVMFDMFSDVDDPNIVSLEYVGSDPSSLMTRADLIKEEEVAADGSASLFKIIAIGASAVTLIMLIVGAWKMRAEGDEDDITLDGKPIDDKSLAVETAAMTAITGLTSASGCADDTSSDISSTTDVKDVKEFYKNKAFVLAEEEEGNWRNLGILPNQLADINEEFSLSGSSLADEKSM